MDLSEVNIISAGNKEDIESAKQLFLEYAKSLNFDLCFQGFDEELKNLPGDYSPPEGELLLAYSEGKLAGCVAFHKFENDICEMKRLFLRSEFRGQGIGRQLTVRVIDDAKKIGYKKMRLDTLPAMKEAIQLYKDLGFNEINPYRYNPIEGVCYMGLEL
jgi:ribosomal protein S18 acetylase RimI-like enzyme